MEIRQTLQVFDGKLDVHLTAADFVTPRPRPCSLQNHNHLKIALPIIAMQVARPSAGNHIGTVTCGVSD